MATDTPAIGIDLGTTNSCVGVFRNGRVEIIADENNSKIIPSVVTFTDTAKLLGTQARDAELIENPENAVYGIKRLVGREFLDSTVQSDIKHWPFKVVSNNGKPAIKARYMGAERTFHPEEISAMILEKMASIAGSYLGHPVKDVVITVPAYFDNNQRQATRHAGKIAGLNVLRLMNEPTAAAVAYGLEKKTGGSRNVLVYDLGGGTFDVSVLVMEGATFCIKSVTGDSHLGGEDFDQRMVDHFAKEIQIKFGSNVYDNKRAMRRLSRACEKAKVQLSSSPQASFSLEYFMDGKPFESSITRAKFEDLNKDLFDATMETVKKALRDAGLEKSRIDDVVLVGGSTRIPRVQELLQIFFQKQRLNKNINPDEAVAYGAAIQAAQLAGNPSSKLKNLVLYDVVPLSLGVKVIGGLMSTIIKRNQSIPITRDRNYTTTVDNQTAMDVEVYEGERALTRDNNFLGEMLLDGIPPEPRGYASVDVTFEIDDNCILHVKARDRDSGSFKEISIINNSRKLNEGQVNRLVQEAEVNRLTDRMNSLRIEAMNELEFYVHDIKSALTNMNFVRFVKPQQKQEIMAEVEKVSTWMNSSSGQSAGAREYESMKATLQKVWDPVVTMVNQNTSRNKTSSKPVLFAGD